MGIENKDKAVSFLLLSTRGKTEEAFSKFLGPGFKHHNPLVEGSVEAMKAALQRSFGRNPEKILEVKRALAEGDFVAVRSHVRMTPNDRGYVLAHFFRFEDGLIAEMWDSSQPVPEKSLNEKGCSRARV